MRLTLGNLLALSCVYLGAACEPQATPSYSGEPLLSLVGSVTIEDDHTKGKLVPALAFENIDNGRLEILEVESRGEFPSNFELKVYTQPGQTALMKGPPGEPRYAIGHVTAVTEGHAPFVRFDDGQSETSTCSDNGCYEEVEACTADGSACYRETRVCDSHFKNCVVTEMSGDPSLLDDPFESFAGLSSNYLVLYLTGVAKAGSELAKVFGGGARLDVGYHLLSVHHQTPAESEAAAQCAEEAEQDVIAAYNEAHGTSYRDVNAPEACPDNGEPCDPPDADVYDDLYDQVQDRVRERGCDNRPEVYKAIPHPEKTPISIHISPDVRPDSAQGSSDG